jgi:hypothetical protein
MVERTETVKNQPITDPKLYARVEVLEHTMQQVATQLSDLNKNFTKFVEKQQDVPRAMPFKEIAGAIVACFAIFFYVETYVSNKVRAGNEQAYYRIEQLERRSIVVPHLMPR